MSKYPPILHVNPERTDLPLVAMPCVTEPMIAPFERWFGLFDDVARLDVYTEFTHDKAEFVRRCAGARAVIVIGVHIDDATLRALAAQGVECLAFGGTGVASYIDLALARELGVRVCNAVHYGDHAVAEFAIALMFELARRVGELDSQTRAGLWDTRAPSGIELYGKKLAIVGLGGIGRTVARIAQGIGMKVYAWRSPSSRQDYLALDVTPVDDMDELFALADVVSIHMPLNEATRGLITAENLESLRPGTMFVNTARAEVIEPGALVKRLERGDIPAALDVYDTEPLPKDSPLFAIPGLVLTPHAAWQSDGAYAELTHQCVEAVVAFLQGRDFNVAN